MTTTLLRSDHGHTRSSSPVQMNHAHHGHGQHGGLARLSFTATLHCLSGCAIGEVLGMVIGTALGWGNGATIALAVILAFAMGYAFTLVPLRRAGLPTGAALKLALMADTASIAVMELVDNAVMLLIPGAMDANLSDLLFWSSLGGALVVAGLIAWPVNAWLIARGGGHALVHALHATPNDHAGGGSA